MQTDIPLHQLTAASFLAFPLEGAVDETFADLHRHDFFELLWFTAAAPTDQIEVDFTTYPLAPDAICLLQPGQVVRFELTSQRGYVLAFARELFHELLGNQALYGLGQPVIPLTDASLPPLRQLLALIVAEQRALNRPPLLKAYLTAFLFHVVAAIPAQPAPTTDVIRRLLTLIEDHYLTQRAAAYYADQLHLSVQHLNALARRERGATVKELLQQRLLLEAKREVTYGRLSLKEVAFKLGFQDPAYFSRFFKAQTGLGAEQFRQTAPGCKAGPQTP